MDGNVYSMFNKSAQIGIIIAIKLFCFNISFLVAHNIIGYNKEVFIRT